MKFKSKILSAIVMGVTTIGMLMAGSQSYATQAADGGLYLGIDAVRRSGYSYKALEHVLHKICVYDSTGTVTNKDRAIYCLKGGPGFGSRDDMGSVTNNNERRRYTQYFDMKDPNSIPSPYKNVLPSGEDYNSLVWILENSYVPAPQNANQNQIDLAKSFRENLLANAGIENSEISDDEIEIVQQLAIWYYTNKNEYKDWRVPETKTVSILIKQGESQTEFSRTIGDLYGWDREEDINTLLAYFIDQAEANKGKVPSPSTAEGTIKIESANAVIAESQGNYKLGPYTIVNNSNYNIEGSLTDASGNTINGYQIVDSNNQVTDLTAGKDIYILVPKTQNVKGTKFTIKAKVFSSNVTFWSVEGASAIEQPVAEVTHDMKEITATASTSEFDLALRKFITKINGENVSVSREPIVSAETLENLKNNQITTVTKTHTKDPVKVKTGDTVLYTIRIYNEGKIDGYAKEVTDYLPTGLKLKENSTINDENGWSNPSGDEKTIVTTKLGETLLNKFNSETNNISYADLQIECVVTASYSGQKQSLKNVAEITSHSDASGNTSVVDRDSIPDNLTDDQKSNYNPGTSTQGWGYEDDDDYEELILPKQDFDLALRKFITNINGKELVNADGTYVREPNIDVTKLVNGAETTAEYKHRKEPVGVAVGDIVIYTIRVYNEGKVDGYASSVTDYLPPQLEFVVDDDENFNAKYGWQIDSSLRKATTTILKRDDIDPEANLLKAFDDKTLDYKELKIKCRVKSTSDLDKVITNIAEITAYTDKDGNVIVDRDSSEKNVVLPSDENLPDYKGNSNNKSILTDSTYFYKGQEDDDDFEKLILQEFDLALRKFITGVNDKEVINRIPKFTKVKDENGNYVYEHTKEPVEVETADIVEYTIRIFNEGDIAGYAKVVKDDIPEGLEFLPNNELNKQYRWTMLDKDGNTTEDVTKAAYITTDYLSKEQEKTAKENLIKEFDQSTMESPDYRDVKVAFKVVAPSTHQGIITNVAEIADDSDEEGNPINDRDSTPNNNNKKEDDIDVEHIKLNYFDLALRKFITRVNDKEVTNRYPVFKIDENGDYVYEHTKEPVDVMNGDIVTYTIRVYNEGPKAGYAEQVKDDIPKGLEFLPDNEINKENRWTMLDKDGNATEDVTKAVSIVTDKLSKANGTATGTMDGVEYTYDNNILLPFEPTLMKEPHYKEVKVAFKVTEPNTSDRIIINQAQISEDADENGNPVIDIDSTPDKWIDGEDDQDIEKIKVKYFDLALRKWVTQAIVIENGKEKVTETGHKAEDDPEEVVKVELVESKINKVVVKFRYKIRITNEGEIEGYCTEISDYIPEGLKFVAADNPNWKEVDGKIVTDQLKDTLLKPGESAEVEVLLTWINSKDNLGLKVNVAEISKDKNDSNTPDIDSTPNNKKPGEDDIDDAPVILSVKTGAGLPIEYVATIGGSIILLASGAILIKKFVLE